MSVSQIDFDSRAVFLAHFGAALRGARQARGLTLSQVAAAAKVGHSSVQRWEAGLSAPDVFELVQLFSLLGDGIGAMLSNLVSIEKRKRKL